MKKVPTVKPGDFVELDYIGRIRTTNVIFDLTNPLIAKKEGIKLKVKPIRIIVGRKQVIPGLDRALIGKKANVKFIVNVNPDHGFGKRVAKLIKLVPLREFKRRKINPYPGLRINVDGLAATILSRSGGRILVDFNHPLSGKDLKYTVTIKKIIKDPKEKVNIIVRLFNISAKIEFKDKKVVLITKKPLPDPIKKEVSSQIKKYTNYELTFEVKEDGDDNKTSSGQSTNAK